MSNKLSFLSWFISAFPTQICPRENINPANILHPESYHAISDSRLFFPSYHTNTQEAKETQD